MISGKIVYQTKRDKSGNVTSYKSRVTGHGFRQEFRKDFKETFAPTVKFSIIRLVIAEAVIHSYYVEQADVDSAFPQATFLQPRSST